MTKLAIGTDVTYHFGRDRFKYEIVRNSATDNKVDGLYFGKDSNGNILSIATGIFDYVLAEYNEHGDFVRNLACKQGDIEKRT